MADGHAGSTRLLHWCGGGSGPRGGGRPRATRPPGVGRAQRCLFLNAQVGVLGGGWGVSCHQALQGPLFRGNLRSGLRRAATSLGSIFGLFPDNIAQKAAGNKPPSPTPHPKGGGGSPGHTQPSIHPGSPKKPPGGASAAGGSGGTPRARCGAIRCCSGEGGGTAATLQRSSPFESERRRQSGAAGKPAVLLRWGRRSLGGRTVEARRQPLKKCKTK